MILDIVAFNRVCEVTGYPHAEYRSATADPKRRDGGMLVKFFVYAGTPTEPTRGKFVVVNEDFEVVATADHMYLESIDHGPAVWKTTPH